MLERELARELELEVRDREELELELVAAGLLLVALAGLLLVLVLRFLPPHTSSWSHLPRTSFPVCPGTLSRTL